MHVFVDVCMHLFVHSNKHDRTLHCLFLLSSYYLVPDVTHVMAMEDDELKKLAQQQFEVIPTITQIMIIIMIIMIIIMIAVTTKYGNNNNIVLLVIMIMMMAIGKMMS